MPFNDPLTALSLLYGAIKLAQENPPPPPPPADAGGDAGGGDAGDVPWHDRVWQQIRGFFDSVGARGQNALNWMDNNRLATALIALSALAALGAGGYGAYRMFGGSRKKEKSAATQVKLAADIARNIVLLRRAMEL
ncbi:MAG: hypothetical protein ONA69_03125 [candidate division KSB1 bacterium]|nr:hypothetical protein [candidate division KSB1 bacterium]